MRFKYTVLCLLGVFCSCSTSNEKLLFSLPKDGDYIVFGKVNSYCAEGDCRELFLLTKDNLYKDSDVPTPLDEITFSTNTLPQNLFELTANLWLMPNDLKSNDINQEHLIQSISDTNFHLSGRVNEVNFSITYDLIDSIQNPSLFDYSQMLSDIIYEIQ